MARYACTITVQTGEMPSTQTNFVWVAVTTNFPTEAIDGGSKSILDGGGNLRFYTDDTKATRIPLEIVEFTTGATPKIIVWGLASLGVGDTVYIEADTVATSQPADNAQYGTYDVWADFELVIHQGSIVDSTGNHTPSLAGSPSLASMMWDGQGYDFQSTGQYISVPHATSLNIEKDYSIDIWSDAPNDLGAQFYLDKSNFNADGFRFFKSNSTNLRSRHPDLSDANLDSSGASGLHREASTFNGTTRANLRDAVVLDSDTPTGTVTTTTTNLIVANNEDFDRPLDGVLGELWLAITERSASRVSEQNNQSNPAAFWSTSSWEDQDSSITIIPTSIASAESFGTPTIITGGVLISPVAIATEETVGSPNIAKELSILPPAIPSEESVGDPVIELILQQIFPNGIPTEAFVGQPAVLGGAEIVIPVLSRQTWNAVAKYLRGLVFKGADNDVIVAWLRSEGLEEGAYNDLWHNYLLQNGFLDGSLTDKYAAWRQNLAGDDPWLLSDGNWNDTKIWMDNETWRDN
jgi:hypothetical protein